MLLQRAVFAHRSLRAGEAMGAIHEVKILREQLAQKEKEQQRLRQQLAIARAEIGYLRGEFTAKRTRPNLDRILMYVAREYSVPIGDIKGRSQEASIAWARHNVFYLASVLTRMSSMDIGRAMNRDHSSVLHGVRRVRTCLNENEPPSETVRKLEHLLGSACVATDA